MSGSNYEPEDIFGNGENNASILQNNEILKNFLQNNNIYTSESQNTIQNTIQNNNNSENNLSIIQQHFEPNLHSGDNPEKENEDDDNRRFLQNKRTKEEEPKTEKNKNINSKRNEKKPKGKKHKGDERICEHTKYSNDNTLNKIKTAFFNTYIIDVVKKESKNQNIELKKLSTEFTRNVSKENNAELFDKPMKEIFSKQKQSSKYKNFESNTNVYIIKKIFEEKDEEKIETNVKKILDLTYEELLVIFRRRLEFPGDKEKIEEIKKKVGDIGLFKSDIYKDAKFIIEKLEKAHEDKEYIKKFKEVCRDYFNIIRNKRDTKNTKDKKEKEKEEEVKDEEEEKSQ